MTRGKNKQVRTLLRCEILTIFLFFLQDFVPRSFNLTAPIFSLTVATATTRREFNSSTAMSAKERAKKLIPRRIFWDLGHEKCKFRKIFEIFLSSFFPSPIHEATHGEGVTPDSMYVKEKEYGEENQVDSAGGSREGDGQAQILFLRRTDQNYSSLKPRAVVMLKHQFPLDH